uniref:Uncharacterized protein n=1 Tax=Globodera rostochiensis TaxID=31243 RepID=A0A914I914_GLORO
MNDNAHFTPQQLSKLINLHIKSHQCIAAKCKDERQQLLNTIEKLARHFYDVYKIHEKQKREMNRIVNLHNDFCAQFGLPSKVETTKQHEFNQIDKIAHMIYEHFIKVRDVNRKNETQQTDGLKHSPMNINAQSRNLSSSNMRRKKASSSSSIMAIDHENPKTANITMSNGNKIENAESLRGTNNEKRSSIIVNYGSIPATNSSLSPPDGVIEHQCPAQICTVSSKITSNFVGERMQIGNLLSAAATNGQPSLLYEKRLKRPISPVNGFVPNKIRVVESQQNGAASFATPSSSRTIGLTQRPLFPLNVAPADSGRMLDTSRILSSEIANSCNSLHGGVSRANKKKTMCQHFVGPFPKAQHPPPNSVNAVGGTVLITEGRELPIGLLSALQPPTGKTNNDKQSTANIVIQLDDDD